MKAAVLRATRCHSHGNCALSQRPLGSVWFSTQVWVPARTSQMTYRPRSPAPGAGTAVY